MYIEVNFAEVTNNTSLGIENRLRYAGRQVLCSGWQANSKLQGLAYKALPDASQQWPVGSEVLTVALELCEIAHRN